MVSLRDLAGEGFERMFKDALLRAIVERERRRAEEESKVIDGFIASAFNRMIGERRFYVQVNVEGRYRPYDVLLCAVPPSANIRRASTGRYRLNVQCPALESVWLAAFFNALGEAERLIADQENYVVLVGRLRKVEDARGVTYRMTVLKAYTMDELAGLLKRTQ